MSVSGTTSYTLTRDQVITYALRKIGVLPLGTSADSTTLTTYADNLNMMIKSWITKGIKLWTIQELTIPLVANQTSYVIGPSSVTPDVVADKPMKLIQAWLRNVSVTPNNDIPLQVISQHNYNEFGSKFSTGTPNSIYMNVGRDSSTISVYDTPDATAASLYQIHILTQRQLYDMPTSSTNFDFPTEWLYALGWNLAAEIAIDFGVDANRLQYIEGKAQKYLTEVEDYDTEYNSVFFTPDMRSRQR